MVPAEIQFNYLAASGTIFDNVQDLPGLQLPASPAAQLSWQWDYITQALCADYIQGQAAPNAAGQWRLHNEGGEL